MKRTIDKKLRNWKAGVNRKSLLVRGMRQTGKTWSIRSFGNSCFHCMVYVDFRKEPEFGDIFLRLKDPGEIVHELSVLFETDIIPSETLIVFDEIQLCPEALKSLESFSNSQENYFVIGAGALPDPGLSGIDILTMVPLSFREFLLASGKNKLANYLESLELMSPVPEPFFTRLNRYLKEYLFVGGMPESVSCWVETGSREKTEEVQGHIINTFYSEFSHLPQPEYMVRVVGLWDSVIRPLGRENSKYRYGDIHSQARAREFHGPLDWLIRRGYLNQVFYREEGRALKHFRLYFPDAGLFRQMAHSADINKKTLQKSLMEGFILTELQGAGQVELYCRREKQSRAVLMLQTEFRQTALEVSVGDRVRRVTQRTGNRQPSVQLSLNNYLNEEGVINIPLFQVNKLSGLSLVNNSVNNKQD